MRWNAIPWLCVGFLRIIQSWISSLPFSNWNPTMLIGCRFINRRHLRRRSDIDDFLSMFNDKLMSVWNVFPILSKIYLCNGKFIGLTMKQLWCDDIVNSSTGNVIHFAKVLSCARQSFSLFSWKTFVKRFHLFKLPLTSRADPSAIWPKLFK